MSDRKAIIFSHARSGTHFLMNTLAHNFGFMSRPFINIDFPYDPYSPQNICLTFKQLLAHPEPNTIKCHYEADFFKTPIKVLLKFFDCFYIYRNVEDVMKSYYKFCNEFDWDIGPKCKDWEEFSESEPWGGVLTHQYKQYPTMYDRWKGHVDGWCKELDKEDRDRIIYVKYEDLNTRFDDTVRMIADRLDKVVINPIRPSKYIDVVIPGEGFVTT